MATDDLGLGTPTPDPTPIAPAGATAEQVQAAIKEGLAGLSGDLRQFGQQIGQYVKQAVEGTRQPTSSGNEPRDPQDLASQLLSDPKGIINKLSDEWAQTRLGPHLAMQVSDRFEDLKEKHRTRVDETYGEGTFESEILPRMEKLLERMQPDARGSSAHFQSVMRTVMGDETMIQTLMDKRAAAKKAREDAPVGILVGSGNRRPAEPRLDSDSLAFMDDYHRVTGTKLDPKLMESILTVRRSDGRWTTQNFPGVEHAKLPATPTSRSNR